MASKLPVKTKLKTTCPECGAEIKLEDTIAAPLIAAKEEEFAAKLKTEMAAAQKKASDQIKAELKDDLEEKAKQLEELKQLGKEREKKLKTAQEKEAQFLAKQRQLEDKERELNLTIEKRITSERDQIMKKVHAEVEQVQGLKLKEKDEQLLSMKRKIEELQKKAAQGSEQLQGEAMELHLEESLNAKFPHDRIEEIPKGISGADLQQHVTTPTGQPAGSILWELKRTKKWSNEWTGKLKTDQRNAAAEMAILVSETRPPGLDTFEFYEGVYVCAPRYALPLAMVTRQTLIAISKTRLAQTGQKDKMALVYDYLTGSQFKHRVEAICEQFQIMQTELTKERAAMGRLWAKREKQIQAVIDNTVGLYGDLEGIAGQSMPQIEGLELELLANEEE